MADTSTCELLVEMLAKLFPNLSPQIVPGAHHSKRVLQAVQSGIVKSQLGSHQSQGHCNWCGQEDFSGVQGEDSVQKDGYSCEKCRLLLDLKKLLHFLITADPSAEKTKLYSLASHLSAVNGHNSPSGEDDVRLLQQAAAITHSLHIQTKVLADTIVQGPNGEAITLDSVDEVVEALLNKTTDSTLICSPKGTGKPKKRKSQGRVRTSTEGTPCVTSNTESSTGTKDNNTRWELSNGHLWTEKKMQQRESGCETPKDSKERKRRKSSVGVTKKTSVKRRSLPAMKPV